MLRDGAEMSKQLPLHGGAVLTVIHPGAESATFSKGGGSYLPDWN